jgi:hypothetical protein
MKKSCLLRRGGSFGRSFLGTPGAAARGLGQDFTNQFRAPDTGDKLARAVIVEFNCGPVIVAFHDGAIAVKFVTDGLAFDENLHSGLLERFFALLI